MKQARVKLLQSMPIFGGLRKDTLEFLVDHANIVRLTPGDFFFREGEDAISMFVLERGKVAVAKEYNDEERLIKHLSQGDCFGEMALLDLYPRSASVMAVEPSEAIEIPSSMLLKLYEHDLEQFTIIQMNIGREISRRLRAADKRLFQSEFDADKKSN